MFGIPIGTLINIFAALAVLFAFAKGGRAERLAATVVLVNLAIGQATQIVAPDAEKIFRLCNDGLAAIALLAVTITFAAPWLGAVMLLYAGQFALHSYYLVLDKNTYTWTFAALNNIDFSGVTWCLIIGTAVSWRQRVVAARQPDPFLGVALQPAE